MTTLTPSIPTRARKLRGYRAYLEGVDHRPARSRVLQAYRRGVSMLTGAVKPSLKGMNDARREALQDAIFEVENEIESRQGGKPDDATVIALRRARQRVELDLRWSDA